MQPIVIIRGRDSVIDEPGFKSVAKETATPLLNHLPCRRKLFHGKKKLLLAKGLLSPSSRPSVQFRLTDIFKMICGKGSDLGSQFRSPPGLNWSAWILGLRPYRFPVSRIFLDSSRLNAFSSQKTSQNSANFFLSHPRDHLFRKEIDIALPVIFKFFWNRVGP